MGSQPGGSEWQPPALHDLRRMSPAELDALARRVRARLVEVVAANGGHLAPNLGVVELTIALHRSFASPRDRIVWDVGHQSYVHKMLTGRWAEMDSLRRLGGISGFPKRSESPHDAFDTGHASTSVSAALGMAKARDLRKESHHVVAVIGDGALSGGMAFEALNNAGQAGTRVVIVLNDNSMSISRSLGGLAAHLARARTSPAYSRTKRDIKSWLDRFPGGPEIAGVLGKVRDSLKYLLIPGVLFEEFGLTYLGPVDGHDIARLEEVLGQAKAIDGPVVVHCLTRKGKGYAPAEANPRRFHGVGPFDPAAEQAAVRGDAGRGHARQPVPGTSPNFSDVFGQALVAAAEADTRVCAITAAMPDGTGLREFFQRFPARAFDVCIAEQHAVTFAAGLAVAGMRPVVAIYSTFLQRAYDQVLHDVCLQGLPVVFALDRAGLVGEDGETHHGLYDLAYLRAMPGMAIAVPRDGSQLRAMLALGLRHEGPLALRYPRGTVPTAEVRGPAGDADQVELGRGELLRDGSVAGVLAVGPVVHACLAAAAELAGQGLEVAVADAKFVKPLDLALLRRLVANGRPLLVVEEGVAAGGLGGAVLEALMAAGWPPGLRVKLHGLPDQPPAHGTQAELRALMGLDQAGIAKQLRDLIGGSAGTEGALTDQELVLPNQIGGHGDGR